MKLTADAVLALAPDASSVSAARGLVAPAKWTTTGANDLAVWGACQGSGSKPYQTQVAFSGSTPAFHCSCPSRKFPCKHGLALLLLRAQQEGLFTQTDVPAWVSERLSARADKEQKKEEKQREKAAAAPLDAELTEQRDMKKQAQRWAKIEAAALELQGWMVDQIASGLGVLTEQQQASWQSMAARLVDAQAPGLAIRVRMAAQGIRQSTDWPEVLLHRLGLLQLLCQAILRRSTLSPDQQAEIRSIAGWPYEKLEVLASGERVADHWTVIGQIMEEGNDKLIERRVWLHGERTGRRAMLQEHTFAGKGFQQVWLNGASMEGTLAYFPGSSRLRAQVAEQVATAASQWPDSTLAAEWQRITERVACSPWVRLHPLVLSSVLLLPVNTTYCILVEQQTLPLILSHDDNWNLLAFSGGHPIHVMGEWDGRALRLLSAWNSAGHWQRNLT